MHTYICIYNIIIPSGLLTRSWLRNPQIIYMEVYSWENHLYSGFSTAMLDYWRVCVCIYIHIMWIIISKRTQLLIMLFKYVFIRLHDPNGFIRSQWFFEIWTQSRKTSDPKSREICPELDIFNVDVYVGFRLDNDELWMGISRNWGHQSHPKLIKCEINEDHPLSVQRCENWMQSCWNCVLFTVLDMIDERWIQYH